MSKTRSTGASVFLEPVAPTVEHLVGAVGAGGVHAVRRRGADHVCATPPCELGREVADTARRAVDHDPLPCFEPTVVEEPLPGAEGGKGSRCARHVVERRRLGREQACRDRGIRRCDTVAIEVGERIDRLADRHGLDVGSHCGHDPGELVRGDRGQAIDGPLELVAGDRGRVHLDERFACA